MRTREASRSSLVLSRLLVMLPAPSDSPRPKHTHGDAQKMDSVNSGRGNTVNTAVVLKEELWVAPTHRERRGGGVRLWWEKLPLTCSVSRRLGGLPCGGGSKTHGMLNPTCLYLRVSPTSSPFRWDPGSLPPTPGSNDTGGSTPPDLSHCSALVCHFFSLGFWGLCGMELGAGHISCSVDPSPPMRWREEGMVLSLPELC